MLWEPSIGESVAHLPDICLADHEIWQTMSPLICFETVEWHRLERVLISLAFIRRIPPSCSLEQDLHLVDKQECHKYDWEIYHAQYIALWATCAKRIVTSPPTVGNMDFHDPYMKWYRRITRSLMAPPLHRNQMRYPNIALASHLLVGKRL